MYCALSYKSYCAYTPSNGARALLNTISVFRIPPLFVLNVFIVENKSCKSGVAWDTTRSDLLFCGNLQIYSP